MDRREHRLSDLLGAAVVDRDARRLGRLDDLTLRLGDGTATVDRLLVRPRRGGRPTTLPWRAVAEVSPDRIVVATATAGESADDEPADNELAEDELLLGRDVLDTQIVDLEGKRLVRVADVLLAERPDHGLRAIAVDTGFGAVVRRLGLHRLGNRLAEDAVAWDALHLTSARGHTVQLGTPAATVHHLSPADIGLLLDAVTTDAAVELVRRVHPDMATGGLAAAHPHTTRRIERAMHHSGDAGTRRTRRHDGWRRRVPARR